MAADRVTSMSPLFREGPTPPPVPAIDGSLALGVASRCWTLLGTSPLDDELVACRTQLGQLDPETIESARASAGELALRAAAAPATQRGSRSLLLDDHAQRLAGEALFVLVYVLRPGSARRAARRAARRRLSQAAGPPTESTASFTVAPSHSVAPFPATASQAPPR